MEEVSHLVIKVSSDDVAKATSALGSLEKASDRVMGIIKGLVTAAAALAVFRQAAAAIAEFDHNMQAVLAVLKATNAEMTELKTLAREVGSTTQISGAEAALGMKYLGQAGFSTNQIIAAMPGMLDLAVAGELDLANAADITTAALAGFRLKAGDASKMADVLAVAAGESNTSVFQMGDAMKYVAPIAAGMNKTLEEVSAALGVLSNAGLQGTMAGTGLRQVLSSLASPTKEAADILNAYGIKIDEVNPEIHSLAEVIDRLKGVTISASDALVIAGDRGGNALIALTSQADAFHKLNASMGNVKGRAHEMAQVMGDDLTGDMKKLKGATNELFLALGDAGLRDVMRGAAKDTREFILAMADMVKSGEAAAWLDLLKDKFMLLGGDAIENATANITAVWGLAMDYISGTGADAANDIKHAFTNMPENIRTAVQLVAITFENLWESIVNSGGMAVDQVINFFKYLLDMATNVGKEIWDQISNAGRAGKFDYVKEQSAAFDKFQAAATAAKDKANAANQAAADAWAEEVTNILNERDANIASSDAKIKKIDELRAAYAKLKADRLAAEGAAAEKAGVVGPAGTPPKGPSHFNTQEYEQLRLQLQLEEKTVKESYAKRLDLIRRNTEEGSDLRVELEHSLNDRLLVELDQANQATQDRLGEQYKAKQNQLQADLDNRLITEQEFMQKSRDNWNDYTNAVTTMTVNGSRVISTKQLENYSTVLDLAASISGELSGLVKDNSDAAKAMFIASKAIAIAQAIVYTELASARALAEGGLIFGIPMATVIRALGYASVGIMAATSIAEYGGKFADGGIVPGTSYTGDKKTINVNSGEMVLNHRQQQELWAQANGGGAGGSVSVVVNNNAPGVDVEVTSRQTDQGKVIELAIRKLAPKVVADDIANWNGPVAGALKNKGLRNTGT